MSLCRRASALGALAALALTLVGSLASPPAAAASSTDTLLTSESAHVEAAAVTLTTGRALVVGGVQSGGDIGGEGVTAAEQYVPGATALTGAGSTEWGRYRPYLFALGGGGALVTSPTPDTLPDIAVERYSSASNSWSNDSQGIILNTVEAAAQMPNGRVVLLGTGRQFTNPVTEVYSPGSDSWSSPGAIALGSDVPIAAVAVSATSLLVVAEPTTELGTIGRVRSVLFNASTGRTTPVPMPAASVGDRVVLERVGANVVMVNDGIDIAGPALALEFTPATGAWSGLPPPPLAVSGAAVVHGATTLTLIGGAAPMLVTTCQALAAVQQLDLSSRTWRQLTPLQQGRDGAAATVLGDGRVLVVGGSVAITPGIPCQFTAGDLSLRNAELVSLTADSPSGPSAGGSVSSTSSLAETVSFNGWLAAALLIDLLLLVLALVGRRRRA